MSACWRAEEPLQVGRKLLLLTWPAVPLLIGYFPLETSELIVSDFHSTSYRADAEGALRGTIMSYCSDYKGHQKSEGHDIRRLEGPDLGPS